VLALLASAQTDSCASTQTRPQANRSFSTSFESISEFNGFYIVPQNYEGVDTHGQTTAIVRTGTYAHQGTINGAGPSCPPSVNCNHRGYPTIQMHKTSQGGFNGTVFAELYVYLNMTVASGQWFSFATFSADASDDWSRVVTVNVGNLNLGSTNFVHLMHVPHQGESNWIYQTSQTNGNVAFPFNQWVKLSVCINFDRSRGYAKVWQNDVLVSSADVRDGCGVVQQTHFGLYAYPAISSGTIYNDDLTIQEVSVCPK